MESSSARGSERRFDDCTRRRSTAGHPQDRQGILAGKRVGFGRFEYYGRYESIQEEQLLTARFERILNVQSSEQEDYLVHLVSRALLVTDCQ